MPNWRFSDEFMDDISKSAEESIKRIKESGLSFLGEQEHPESQYNHLSQENKDNFITFCEAMAGRKLFYWEIEYLKGYSTMRSFIPFSPYKPLSEVENVYKNYPSLAYLYGVNFNYNTVDCSYIINTENLNTNCRLYNHETVQGLSIDKFIKELKISDRRYILYPIKNKSEDLQPYKDIVYPWDYEEDSEKIHRKEIKVIGESNNDIYQKSRRYNRKRCKVVSE